MNQYDTVNSIINSQDTYLDKSKDTDLDKSNLDKLKQFVYSNLCLIKTMFALITVLFICWVWYCETGKYKNGNRMLRQYGGAGAGAVAMAGAVAGGKSSMGGPIGLYGSGLNKIKSGMSSIGKVSLLSGGFTYLFQFINVIFMLIGIVVLLILIPSLPIIFFVLISYFIAREKLWQLRTL